MKYYYFAFLFIMPVLTIFSQENIRIYFSSSSTLRWNEKDTFHVSINNDDADIPKMNITILPNETLVFIPNVFSIENVLSKKNTRISLEISSNKKAYFFEKIPVKLSIETSNFVQEETLHIYLSPAKYFWLTVNSIIVIILLITMAIIYIKLVKGEK